MAGGVRRTREVAEDLVMWERQRSKRRMIPFVQDADLQSDAERVNRELDERDRGKRPRVPVRPSANSVPRQAGEELAVQAIPGTAIFSRIGSAGQPLTQ